MKENIYTQKVIILFFLLFGFYSVFSQDMKNFEIKGTGLESGEKVFLLYYPVDDSTQVNDSCLVKNGHFMLKGQIIGPCMAGVLFGKDFQSAYKDWTNPRNIWFTLFKGNTNLIFKDNRLQLDGGNEYLELVDDFNEKYTEYREVFDTEEYKSHKQKILNKKTEIKQLEDSLKRKFGAPEDAQKRAITEFVKENPRQEYNLLLIKQLISLNKNYDDAYSIYESLDESLKNSAAGKQVKNYLEKFNYKAGIPAPNFSQPDGNGVEVKLSDYKGQYVLVDFWASWCGPCRAENPNLIKTYERFKDSNFEILGVSLDDKRENWLKAIEKDGLPWKNISDLNGWKNTAAKLYDIKAIPSNVLVDPKGNIMATDLRGDKLVDFLERNITK